MIGLIVLALGGVGYLGFEALGIRGFSAGIAAQSLLVLIVVVWTGSYLFRVVTGQMTYMNQRRRYREVYDTKERADLQARFDALPEDGNRLCCNVWVWMAMTSGRTHRLIGLIRSRPGHAHHPSAF